MPSTISFIFVEELSAMKKLFLFFLMTFSTYCSAQIPIQDSIRKPSPTPKFSIWLGFDMGSQYFRLTDASYFNPTNRTFTGRPSTIEPNRLNTTEIIFAKIESNKYHFGLLLNWAISSVIYNVNNFDVNYLNGQYFNTVTIPYTDDRYENCEVAFAAFKSFHVRKHVKFDLGVGYYYMYWSWYNNNHLNGIRALIKGEYYINKSKTITIGATLEYRQPKYEWASYPVGKGNYTDVKLYFKSSFYYFFGVQWTIS